MTLNTGYSSRIEIVRCSTLLVPPAIVRRWGIADGDATDAAEARYGDAVAAGEEAIPEPTCASRDGTRRNWNRSKRISTCPTTPSITGKFFLSGNRSWVPREWFYRNSIGTHVFFFFKTPPIIRCLGGTLGWELIPIINGRSIFEVQKWIFSKGLFLQVVEPKLRTRLGLSFTNRMVAKMPFF